MATIVHLPNGKIRIPLLRDHHNHPMLYAALREGIDLNESSGETRDSAVDRIRRFAQRGNAGWSIAHGWNSGRYLLLQSDFDDLPPVVIFNLSLHGIIVNSAGRELLKWSDPQVAANLDNTDWIERNLRRVLNVFASAGASAERLQQFFQWLLHQHGVYEVEELLLVGETEIRLVEEANLKHRIKLWAAPDLYDSLPSSMQQKIHGIKLFTDGALGTRTAALSQNYRDEPQSGMLLYEQHEIETILRHALDAGKAMALHAIGDRAIDQVVNAVENVQPAAGSEIRIEHAQLISEATAHRARNLGNRLSMQPNFSDDSLYYADRLPEGFAERNNPFRMLIDQVGYVPGADLLFGSDGMPHGVREALRQSLFPAPEYLQQTLTLEEFVAGYCLPNQDAGHIEVAIDHDRRNVVARVVSET